MAKLLCLCLLSCLVFTTGCQKAYYNTMEAFGYHKREMLVDRVQDSRDAQEQAKEQFKTALEKFSEVVSFEGGELEKKYDQLKSQLSRCEDKADRVSNRIKEVETVADALFDEWLKELDQYTSDDLRRSSEDKMLETKQNYDRLIRAMRRAESKMEPVLAAFRDQVLFLKHNLNAVAVASLQDELVDIEADIATLIIEMEESIAEADAFISDMSG
ncbi:MAG: DUF2959 domain-containing protein [Phycisphaerales bacterium]